MWFDDNLSNLMLKYPGLSVKRQDRGVLISGVINLQSIFYRLKLHCPNYPDLNNFKFHVNQQQQLKQYDAANITLEKNWTVLNLLEQLQLLIPVRNTPMVNEYSNNSAGIYRDIIILNDLNVCKIQLNAALTCVKLSNFKGYEHHFVELELPSLRIHEHSLPDCVAWQALFQNSARTLAGFVELFQKYLQDLQPFYATFQNIDELCFVVEPTLPTTKQNWRLFLLVERVYLKLTIVDPFSTISSMRMQILGPTHEVEGRREMLSTGISSWDAECNVYTNLLRIFDLCYFPMLSRNFNPSEQLCNICFHYRLNGGQVPIISCDNTHCSLIFHAACLREWFNTLSDGKTFLNVTFGTCPFCKSKLSASFAELLTC